MTTLASRVDDGDDYGFDQEPQLDLGEPLFSDLSDYDPYDDWLDFSSTLSLLPDFDDEQDYELCDHGRPYYELCYACEPDMVVMGIDEIFNTHRLCACGHYDPLGESGLHCDYDQPWLTVDSAYYDQLEDGLFSSALDDKLAALRLAPVEAKGRDRARRRALYRQWLWAGRTRRRQDHGTSQGSKANGDWDLRADARARQHRHDRRRQAVVIEQEQASGRLTLAEVAYALNMVLLEDEERAIWDEFEPDYQLAVRRKLREDRRLRGRGRTRRKVPMRRVASSRY
jgi:hypothetical protein